MAKTIGLDYITVTSVAPIPVMGILDALGIEVVKTIEDARIVGFKGLHYVTGLGSAYDLYDSGMHRPYLVQFTSSLAESVRVMLFEHLWEIMKSHGVDVMDMPWQVTRIDVALDVERDDRLDGFAARQVADDWFASSGGRCPKMRVYSSEDGDTLYIGSSSSTKQWRIYQKSGAWRYEVQLRNQSKSRYAMAAAMAIANEGSKALAMVYNAHRYGFFPEIWGGVLPRGNVSQETNTEKWLYGVVRKALSKVSIEVAQKFIDMCQYDVDCRS